MANQEGKAIAAVDLSAFAVARHIPLDGEPTEVVAPEAHPLVFALTPASGSLHAISLEHLKFQRTLRLGAYARKMLHVPGDGAIYVLLDSPRKLVRVSLERFAVDGEIALPEGAIDFDLTPTRLATAGVLFDGGRFATVDLKSGKLGAPVKYESEFGALRFQSNGEAFLVSDLAAKSLHVFETSSLKRIAELPLAVRPDNLCFSADGGQLFVTGSGADVVCVVYPYYTPQVAETVLAGRAPAAMAASSDPRYLFVTNPTSGDVSILNVRDRKMVAVVSVGAEPRYVTVTPDSQYALVLNRKSGDMAVLRIGGIQRNRQKSAGLFTMIPVGSAPVSAAIRMV
ncbi:hypothetical protein F183_A44530 [Bryobacterales bacterium F-183]|nr:hypothetical protein F183_A44530 [Bryobacterales bacterium F-183]